MARKLAPAPIPSAFDWPPGVLDEAERLAGVLRDELDHRAACAALHPTLIGQGTAQRRRTRDEPPLLPSGPSPLAEEMLRARL